MSATLACRCLMLGAVLWLAAAAATASADGIDPLLRWTVEPKVGHFEPDLPDYQMFYDGSRSRYLALAFAYRITDWLEAGGEIGRSRDRGVGRLPTADLGGRVEYTLYPAQIFVNLRWEPSRRPLLVPYAGVGFVRAHYRQNIDLQPRRRGRTDLGTSIRAGLQLSLDRLDRSVGYGEGVLKRTFLSLEAQRFSTEIDDIDLGGDVYLLGFRFELGRAARRPVGH